MEIKEIIIIFIVTCVLSTDAFNTTAMKHLHASLFQQYNEQIPPFTGNSPISVSVDFSLLDVFALDMRTQYFSTSAALKVSWYDIFLKWNKSDHGNLTEITASLQNIWKPDIIIINSLDHEKELFKISDDGNVVIKNDGLVEVRLFLNLRTRCLVRTTYYPFDTQFCDVIFSNRYLTDKYQILKGNSADVEGIVPNGEWEILKLNSNVTETTFSGNTYHNLKFMTELKRLRTFYTWNFIIPVVALALADLFTFLVPAESSGKMGVSIFVFLSLGVLTRLFNESIPSTAKDVSLFGRLLWINILISGCIIGANTISSALFYSKSPKSISNCCYFITELFKCKTCKCSCCKKCCDKNRGKKSYEIGNPTTVNTTGGETSVRSTDSYEEHTGITHEDVSMDIEDGLEGTVVNPEDVQINMEKMKDLPSIEIVWSDVSRNLDLISGIIFCITYIAVFVDVIVDMINQLF